MLAPANDPRPDQGHPVLRSIIAALGSRTAAATTAAGATTTTTGPVFAVGVYFETRQIWAALLVYIMIYIVVPPAVALGRVAAEWVQLLRPRRWFRRPRRRGS